MLREPQYSNNKIPEMVKICAPGVASVNSYSLTTEATCTQPELNGTTDVAGTTRYIHAPTGRLVIGSGQMTLVVPLASLVITDPDPL